MATKGCSSYTRKTGWFWPTPVSPNLDSSPAAIATWCFLQAQYLATRVCHCFQHLFEATIVVHQSKITWRSWNETWHVDVADPTERHCPPTHPLCIQNIMTVVRSHKSVASVEGPKMQQTGAIWALMPRKHKRKCVTNFPWQRPQPPPKGTPRGQTPSDDQKRGRQMCDLPYPKIADQLVCSTSHTFRTFQGLTINIKFSVDRPSTKHNPSMAI